MTAEVILEETLGTSHIFLRQTRIRDNLREVVEISVPRHSILKKDSADCWYLSIPKEVRAGIVEYRLYGPSRGALTRIHSRGAKVCAILGSIIQEDCSTGHQSVFVEFQLVSEARPTHIISVHPCRRSVRRHSDTTYYHPLEGVYNGVIEIQTA